MGYECLAMLVAVLAMGSTAALRKTPRSAGPADPADPPSTGVPAGSHRATDGFGPAAGFMTRSRLDPDLFPGTRQLPHVRTGRLP